MLIMSGFLLDVLSGLASTPKVLPSKYFYDERGSQLFEQITALPEYYPTRMETLLLAQIAPQISALIPRGAALIEFGSGSSSKTQLLLEAAPQLAIYAPLDISEEALREAARRTSDAFPHLEVAPVVADFTQHFQLPAAVDDRAAVGFFPGSTIGNFGPEDAVRFLTDARKSLGAGARFLIGYDLVKDVSTLEAAYNDAQGVTAAFNLNVLRRANDELGANFELSSFSHRAVWNAAESRMEMLLVSRFSQAVHIAGHHFDFNLKETIRTEMSYKYTEGGFAHLASAAGWRVEQGWTSPPPRFGLVLLTTE